MERLKPPAVAVIVIMYTPGGVLSLVAIVIELVKVGLALEGENPTEMLGSAGETEADRDTGWAVPARRVTATFAVVLSP